jgi:glycerol-3-phosphate acyltransferase PlsY
VDFLRYGATALGAYLLGSVPTGYLVARARGVDIRTAGSGNIGATNVFRVLGKPAGVAVLLVDFVKGLLACGLLPYLIFPSSQFDLPGVKRILPSVVGGFCAVLGHNYTCWLRFRGGKGIATSAGVLSALVPWALLIIFVEWVALFAVTRYVSLGSIAASFTLPFATWFTTRNWLLTIVTGAMAALAIYKHRANIQRLLKGTESRFSFKRKESPS